MDPGDNITKLVLSMPKTAERLLQLDNNEVEQLLVNCKSGLRQLEEKLNEDYKVLKPHLELLRKLRPIQSRLRENRKYHAELKKLHELYVAFRDIDTETILTLDDMKDDWMELENLGDETEPETPMPPPTSPARPPNEPTTPRRSSVVQKSATASKLPLPRMKHGK